jgi:DNA repair ATPase RecN
MFSDSRLQNLQKDLENLSRAQSAIMEDIRSLRTTMDSKIKRIQTEYGNDISALERKYDGNARRIPDVSRQIETRQAELERELQSKTQTSTRKSGW